MKTTRSNTGLVLQGYFRIERFQGTARSGAAAQAKDLARPMAQAPRPELLPAKMQGGAAQAKAEHGSGEMWRGAPRPDLLPGMGPTRVGVPRRVAQTRADNQVSATPIPAEQLRVIGPGRPLEPGMRQAMETFFHADFSGVRVHEGPAAPAMGALAFTLGEEIHFAPGLYDPGSHEGMALLGHELTHVVQQRDERVANPYGHGVAIVQDPALEAEADRLGQWIADEMWSSVNVRYAPGPATPPHELAVPRPSPRRSWTAQRMQGPGVSASFNNTNRGLTQQLPQLVLEIVNTKIDLDKAYQLKGGWEGWLQVELALAAEKYNVKREGLIYTDSNQRVDLYTRGKRNSVAIELKCESVGQSKGFDGKLLDDFLKLKDLDQHSYGIFVGVVTDNNAAVFHLWIQEYSGEIQVRGKVFDTNNRNFCVVVLEAIARL